MNNDAPSMTDAMIAIFGNPNIYDLSDAINGGVEHSQGPLNGSMLPNIGPTFVPDLSTLKEVRKQNNDVEIFARPAAVKGASVVAGAAVNVSIPSGAKLMTVTASKGILALHAYVNLFGVASAPVNDDSNTGQPILVGEYPRTFNVNGLLSLSAGADTDAYFSFEFTF